MIVIFKAVTVAITGEPVDEGATLESVDCTEHVLGEGDDLPTDKIADDVDRVETENFFKTPDQPLFSDFLSWIGDFFGYIAQEELPSGTGA